MFLRQVYGTFIGNAQVNGQLPDEEHGKVVVLCEQSHQGSHGDLANKRRLECRCCRDIVCFCKVRAVTEIFDRFNHTDNLASTTDSVFIDFDLSTQQTHQMRGVYSEYFNIETQHILAGRLLNEIDMIEKRKVCLIGNIVREVLFAPDEDPIGQYIRVNGIYYQVVGVIKPKPRAQIGGRTEESVMIPFKTLQQASNQGDKFWFLCATADDGYSCDKMVEDIKAVLRSQNEISPTDEHAISSFTIAKQFETFDMLFTGINILVWLVGIGTLLAGIIGVSNIMMVTVRERTREIGVRRAIGAKPFDIISQIMSESLLLTSLAGLIGLSVGVFLLDVVNNAMASGGGDASNETFFSNPEIHIGTAVAATVILLFSGLLAGLIPAWRAMQIKPIDAIREE